MIIIGAAAGRTPGMLRYLPGVFKKRCISNSESIRPVIQGMVGYMEVNGYAESRHRCPASAGAR